MNDAGCKDAYDLSLDELACLLGDFAPQEKKQPVSVEDIRIIEGFLEIQRFYEQKRRMPAKGADDVFERLLAIRFGAIKANKKCVELLKGYDEKELLSKELLDSVSVDKMSDDELESLLEGELQVDLFDLQHVRSFEERNQPDTKAERKPCQNFERYRHLFEAVNLDLQQGIRRYYSLLGGENKRVEAGQFYVINGQVAYVEKIAEQFKNAQNRLDARMRVIFSNGTESDLLMRSFQRQMYDDPNGRGITDPNLGDLFASDQSLEGYESNGTIYVLRSNSDNPMIVEHRNLIHKIGVTTTPVATRIANAVNDPTYLMADVEVVATYNLYGINPVKLENLIHKVFSAVQLNIEIQDRFGKLVKPREWFMVPLSVIDELIILIQKGDLIGIGYDPARACLIRMG